MALLRIARAAEHAGELGLAADCYGKILPFIHARPRPVEFEPDAVVDLERRVTAARLSAAADAIEDSPGLSGLAERMARARARLDAESIDVAEASLP